MDIGRLAARNSVIVNGESALYQYDQAALQVKGNVAPYSPPENEKEMIIQYGDILFTVRSAVPMGVHQQPAMRSILNGIPVQAGQNATSQEIMAKLKRSIRIVGVSNKEVPYNNGYGNDPMDPPTSIVHGMITVCNTSAELIRAGDLIVADLPKPGRRNLKRSDAGRDDFIPTKRQVLETKPMPRMKLVPTNDDFDTLGVVEPLRDLIDFFAQGIGHPAYATLRDPNATVDHKDEARKQIMATPQFTQMISHASVFFRAKSNNLFEYMVGVATRDAQPGARFDLVVQPAFKM